VVDCDCEAEVAIVVAAVPAAAPLLSRWFADPSGAGSFFR